MEENTTVVRMEAKPETRSKLERAATYIIMATTLLLPIFFVPGGYLTVPFGKSLILYVGVIAALIAYSFSVLERGTIRIPANSVFLAALAVPAVFLVSSLFSKSVASSVFGYGFEVGTFSFVLLMFVLMFLVSSLFGSRDKIFYAYLLFLASFTIVALYQLVKFAFPGAMSFGLFTSAVTNMVGGWNDLGVFFGTATLLALFTLEMLPLSRQFRALIIAVLGLSLVCLAIINFSTLWILLAVFSFAVFTFIFLTGQRENGVEAFRKRISYASLFVLLFSIVFIFAGDILGTNIAKTLEISNIEVRPSWTTTWEIARQTLGENAVFGSGPNTFGGQWLKWKPANINYTAFWNTDFTYGIGLIPTFLVTTGALGLLAWLLFFVAYVKTGYKIIFAQPGDKLSRYLAISSFFVSLFLWIAVVIYVPSATIFAFAFLFTGLFIASAYSENILSNRELTLYRNPRVGFVAVLGVVFVLVLSLTSGYFAFRNLASTAYFQSGVKAAQAQDISAAELGITKAVGLKQHDIYYRTLVDINMYALGQLVTQDIDASRVEEYQAAFQQILGTAVANGLKAVEMNPENYLNHVVLGQVYESVVPKPFEIQGAYEKAKESYENAQVLNPKNPEILLLLARLEAAAGDMKAAREQANRALEIKPNYVDAYFLLSQIDIASGDIDKAIASVESASVLAPDNAGILFQLGLLKYNDSDWTGASAAFERAISVVSNYANARYFLGLSYDKLGRRLDAIEQFKRVMETNPDNEEVKLILGNLEAGREPFAGVQPPLDNEPEKRDNPPVSE